MKLQIVLSSILFSISSTIAGLCTGVQPYSYTTAVSSNAAFEPAINELKKYPVGSWYSDRANGDQIDQLMSQCGNDVPVIVIYGLPNKDCGAGGYSNGGSNTNSADYTKWIQSLVDRVGQKEVIYVVEPDAVGLISGNSCAQQHGYEDNLKTAIKLISTNAKAHIYVDVASWATQGPAVTVLQALKSAGRVDGIAINTSNYKSTDIMIQMCQYYSELTGGMHCVIDTSRNYNGSPSNEWCNARSAGIGAPPTSNTGNSIVDYFLWLKVPGESDGQCTDSSRSSDAMVGPSAGQFFPEQFTLLWNQGYFVKKGGMSVIGGSQPSSSPSSQPSPSPSPQPSPSPSITYATPGPWTETPSTNYPTPAPWTESPATNYPTPAPWTESPSNNYPTPAPWTESPSHTNFPSPSPSGSSHGSLQSSGSSSNPTAPCPDDNNHNHHHTHGPNDPCPEDHKHHGHGNTTAPTAQYIAVASSGRGTDDVSNDNGLVAGISGFVIGVVASIIVFAVHKAIRKRRNINRGHEFKERVSQGIIVFTPDTARVL